MANVTILGAGGFGLSLALTAYHNGHTVTVWNHSQQTIAEIRRDGERRDKLPGVPIPEEINGNPATIFDFQLKYDSYDVIKEKQQQTNDYSCDVQWVPWGQVELTKVNFDQLICEGRADAQALQHINLNDVIVPTPSNIQQ